MNENDFPLQLGNNVEIESKTKDGRYIIKYMRNNGTYNQIAWSPKAIENIDYQNPDAEALEAISSVKNHLGL